MPSLSLPLNLPCSSATAFNWHLNNGAFCRLSPPNQRTEVMRDYVDNNTKFTFKYCPLGITLTWEALLSDMVGLEFCGKNFDCSANTLCKFTDTATRSVFKSWSHEHRFEPKDDACSLIDKIDYTSYFPIPFLEKEVLRMFRYRHAVTKNDLTLACEYGFASPKFSQLKVAIAGSTGFIGKQLTAFLTSQGHHVIRIRRSVPDELPILSPYSLGRLEDYYLGSDKTHLLDSCDAVINLSGENIAQRWTDDTKNRLKKSRIDHTRVLMELFKNRPPRAWLNASAIGLYAQNTQADEDNYNVSNNTFLGKLTQEWEEAVNNFAKTFIPQSKLLLMRLGVVMHPSGGMLQKIIPSHYACMQLGSPSYISWIDLNDCLYSIYHIINNYKSLNGAINLVSPNPITQESLSQQLSKAIKFPGFKADLLNNLGMSAILGKEASREMNHSMVVKPKRLLESGFKFNYPEFNDSLHVWF